MKCPDCNKDLITKTVKSKNTKVDQCPTCKGIWFDKQELETVLNIHQPQDTEIPSYAAQSMKRHCPHCDKELYEFCYPGTMTIIDACKSCHGFWLDRDEWKSIKVSHTTKNQVICPKCSTKQAKSPTCINCGIVFDKYNTSKDKPQDPDSKNNPNSDYKSYADNIPGLKGRLLRFIDRAINDLS